ncbi:MAG: CYTH domain-containing protein [Oligoflexales bacterium]|nr:CYTH domain-containing protein [Oligoflexales bacterium]
MGFGKTKNQKPVLSFSEKLEMASSARTIERFIISLDKYQKLCAFRHETDEKSRRNDFYYDFPGNQILIDGMSLRIREEEGRDGKKRVTLKFREKATEESLLHQLSPVEIAMWEAVERKSIPLLALEKSKIRPAYAKAKNVGVISTIRSVLFDGGVTIDNCSFKKGNIIFNDYEIRLKKEECREDLLSLFRNQFLDIPVNIITKSRYQRLMEL